MAWTREDDVRDLSIMHDLDVDKLTLDQVAARYHTTRGRVAGLRRRLNEAADRVRCRCKKVVNQTGGMPPKWWVIHV